MPIVSPLLSFSATLFAEPLALAPAAPRSHSAKLWRPQRVVFTSDALDEEFGQ